MYTHVLIIHIFVHACTFVHVHIHTQLGSRGVSSSESTFCTPRASPELLSFGGSGCCQSRPTIGGGWQPDPQKEAPTPSCRGTNKGRLQLRQKQWPLDHLSLRPSEAAAREGLGIHRAAASPPCLAMNQASRPCLLSGCTCPPRSLFEPRGVLGAQYTFPQACKSPGPGSCPHGAQLGQSSLGHCLHEAGFALINTQTYMHTLMHSHIYRDQNATSQCGHRHAPDTYTLNICILIHMYSYKHTKTHMHFTHQA